jgi:hypothetical protein
MKKRLSLTIFLFLCLLSTSDVVTAVSYVMNDSSHAHDRFKPPEGIPDDTGLPKIPEAPAVPEPSAFLMVVGSVGCLLLLRKRR